jgi:glycosyltransferase involved in cell wall biosynthesis
MTEKVSIVLPTLNGGQYLAHAIDSCLTQTHKNIELIIVDGGSTDNTLDIVSSYTNDRVTLLHQPRNSGRLPGALNQGFARAAGDYLTWMQDDCEYMPCAIEEMVNLLHGNAEIGLVYADFWRLDETTGEKTCVSVGPNESLARDNCIGPCHLYRRAVYQEVGDYSLKAFLAEDYEYWLRVVRVTKIMPLHQPLYIWRFHPQSLTGKYYWEALRVRTRIQRDFGYLNGREYRNLTAELHMAQAYSTYQQGDWRTVLQHVPAGILLKPSYIANRGTIAILLRSLGKFIRA